MVNDAMIKQYEGKEIKDDVKKAIQYANNGNWVNTFVSIENLPKYNEIDSLKCVFGADTSINFQYSFILEMTDFIGEYRKDCKEKSADGKKGKGKVLSTLVYPVTALSRLYTLASYGFKVQKRGKNRFLVTSPRYQKLTSISRIMNGSEGYFNYLFIGCDKYDGLTNLGHIDIDHGDIIKLSQAENRHFNVKWISNRADKVWN